MMVCAFLFGIAIGLRYRTADEVEIATALTHVDESVATLIETRGTSALLLERAVPIVYTSLVQNVLPDVDHLLAGGKRRSCAVVGNSAILLRSGKGAAIDAHDLVIRFNWPALATFENDVGKRTDIMLVGRSVSLHSRYSPFASYQNFSRDITVISEVNDFDQWRQLVQNHNERDAPARQYAYSKHWLELTDALVCLRPSVHCAASSGLRGVMVSAAV
jgi:hypothetical protein